MAAKPPSRYTSSVPGLRVEACNRAPLRGDGDYVLYWMIAARRLAWNFALDRALEWCRELRKPLLIFEALRHDFPWETDRTRRFVLDGMAANTRSPLPPGVIYFPYVESAPDAGKGLLAALAARAAVIVTDEYPCFFLPAMVAAASRRASVLMEQVDSNGLLPLRAAPKDFSTAHSFRRFLQQRLPEHILAMPSPKPLAAAGLRPLPSLKPLLRVITARWPVATFKGARSNREEAVSATLSTLRGGSIEAKTRLRSFLLKRLGSYAENRNEPDEDATSGLSPYLHFGHISAHEVFCEIAKQERWKPEKVALRPSGSREGWWGMSPSAEAFLDQFITWRELGFNMCHMRTDYDQYDSLPQWARETLGDHAGERRPYTYMLEEFEKSQTHDLLWNAAQTQLVTEGRIHNYLRMLWGKKILEWTRSPKEALAVMIELNNRYALDGRDPNSYSGIFWCLGRYDRPWGPERPIFGKIRYMSSANAARKLSLKKYLAKYQNKEPKH